MFFFSNSKRIKITVVAGIIPGQLWKPFALMNKDGRNWNTFSFLNTRQALVGRIRQQICVHSYIGGLQSKKHIQVTPSCVFNISYGNSCALQQTTVMFPKESVWDHTTALLLVQHQYFNPSHEVLHIEQNHASYEGSITLFSFLYIGVFAQDATYKMCLLPKNLVWCRYFLHNFIQPLSLYLIIFKKSVRKKYMQNKYNRIWLS
jgi:hypothetical protein